MRFVLVGGDSLLIQCGAVLLERGHEISALISSDDAATVWSEQRNIPVKRLSKHTAAQLASLRFDHLLSIGNLAVLPASVFRLAELSAVNFHDGPLPRYGGINAPVWAILAGELEHAVTWHRIEAGVDAGDILVQRRFAIEPTDTALTLNAKCFEAGIASFDDLIRTLERDGRGHDGRGHAHTLDAATWHGPWDRPDAAGLIDWNRPAREISALTRALDFGPYRNPMCAVKLWLGDGHVIVGRTEQVLAASDRAPGLVTALDDNAVTVSATDGSFRLSAFALPDGQRIAAAEVAARWSLRVGAVLPVVPQALRAAFVDLSTEAARSESTWLSRLETLQPARPPESTSDRAPGAAAAYAHGVPEPFQRWARSLEGSDTDLVRAAVALFLLTFSGRVDGDIAVAAYDPLLPPVVRSLFGGWLPLRLVPERGASAADTVRRIAAEIAAIQSQQPWLADVWWRTPRLREAAPRLPMGLTELAMDGSVERVGDALTVGVSDDRIAWRSEQGTHALAVIAARLDAFLLQLAARPGQSLASLHVLTPTELDLVEVSLCGDERAELSERTLSEEFERRVTVSPDSVAVVFEEESITYRTLNIRANQLARRLRATGIRRSQPVGICLERSVDLVVAVLGVHKAGGAYVPLDPTYPEAHIGFIIADSGVSLIVTQEPLLEVIGPDVPAVCLDREREALLTLDGSDLEPRARADDLAYVIYTSGSTGQPKGVMVEHRNVTNFLEAMDRQLGVVAGGAWLAVTSLSFDISVLELLWTVTRGVKVVLYAEEHRAASGTVASTNADKAIDFSLFYFSAAGDAERPGKTDKYRLLIEGARFADAHGFTAVWTPERHFHAFGGLYPNPSVTGAAIAAVTTRVGIRAGSCVLPLHHPVRVAEEWSVVDNLSNGRVGLSAAAGWQPDDFVLRPESYREAKATMFRDLDTVRRLWRGETISMPGPRGDVQVRCLPRPVQAELPVWITTAGTVETFEAAGRERANVLTHLLGQSVSEIATKITAYRRAWRAAGHAGEGCVSLMLHTFVGDDTDAVREVVRAPMKEYLRTSISLIKNFASAFPTFKRKDDNVDFSALSEDEFESLLEYSFERYFETSGLFGDFDRCAAMIDQLKGIGVDEIACLVDFGVDADVTLAHLAHLNRLRRATTRARQSGDYSVPALIARHGVTHLQCTPSMASMLLSSDRARAALRRLQCVLVGGERLTPALAEDLGRTVPGRIVNMYGPTETTVWSTTSEFIPGSGNVTIGRPVLNTEVFVLDEALRPVPPGEPGELCVGGSGVARGYWKRPELTAERFVRHPRHPARRLYRTGDIVRFDETGALQFLGRRDAQVKVRGYRIELGEIEVQLCAHDAVREAAAVVRERGPHDVRIVAYAVLRHEASANGLREWLKARLPAHMIPADVVLLTQMPRTPNQKIDRNSLPDVTDLSVADAAPASVPASPGLEQDIASIWQTALRRPHVGVDDNFFDLGGHSLLAVQVHGLLRKELNRELAITDLFRYPTIRALARFLDAGADTRAVKASVDRGASRRAAMERRTGNHPGSGR